VTVEFRRSGVIVELVNFGKGLLPWRMVIFKKGGCHGGDG
jgi:hypothetical protein